MHNLTGARVVTSAGVRDGVGVRVDGDRIVALDTVQFDRAPTDDALDLGGGYLVPGFIDMHCHGGADADFGTAGAHGIRRALELHLRHGTTGMLASLVTATVAELVSQIEVLAAVREASDGQLLGVHLEGPFLAGNFCGAQNPDYFAVPDVPTAQALTANSAVRMMTVAPELHGGLDVVAALAANGVLVAVGHTNATYAEATAAFAAGAAVATHVFNGMRPIHHREPGPVVAALNAGAACEIINDGVHLHDAAARLILDHDPNTPLLITDAISATGAGDGTYCLGGQDVRVTGGIARLASNGSLAGSTLTMDEAFARVVTEIGLPIELAVRAASTNPARMLGFSRERGDIAVGLRADLLHLDDQLRIQRVMSGGRWVC